MELTKEEVNALLRLLDTCGLGKGKYMDSMGTDKAGYYAGGTCGFDLDPEECEVVSKLMSAL